MKRIKRFDNFIGLESIDESRVYFLNDLNRKLQELVFDGNEWAGKLLQAQGTDIDSDTTFLNLDGENFSFSREADIRRLSDPIYAQELFNDPIDEIQPPRVFHYFSDLQQNNFGNLSNRGSVKMGRVIKKLLPQISDKDLEKLVNDLRSETSGYEIKLVKGLDIIKYYKRESCDDKSLQYGTLNHSCMMDKVTENKNIFDIYTKNPETCQLAVMLNGEGKLVARALVWKIDEISRYDQSSVTKGDEEKFYSSLNLNWELVDQNNYDNDLFTTKVKELYLMDRVYYTKDWMENSLHKWAMSKGMMIKWRDQISYNGVTNRPILTVSVNKVGYRQFPYLDTFKYYDVQSGKLTNFKISNRGFELQQLRGGYTSTGTKLEKGIDKATNYIRRFKDLV
jgi:hypothetical protein